GAMTIGVVPRLVEQNGRTSTYINVHVPCEDLSDRKSLMMSQADMFIALPGGIGTLDEIFTVAASATIGYHHKPMVLYNINGYWNSLVALLDDMQQKGMVRGDWHSHISVIESLKELNL
ncbi:MAG: LOG family protein, partial [Prevotella sp.]|nr:LOG family protein [Prevotella sp.]